MTATNQVTDYGVVVLPVAEEGFLALGAHEVLHVPVLPQRRHHSLFNRSPKKAQEKIAIYLSLYCYPFCVS
jgi:hypothetical protein